MDEASMTEPMLANVRIVLSRTSHPGNIGAAARAMKTMGLATLYLVRPRRFPDREAIAMASGALDVFERAIVVDSLDAALAGTTLAIALTARPREVTLEVLDPRAGAAVVLDAASAGPVAIVFGSEESGLTNEEVLRCQRIISIPVDAAYASLNVAAAVQVMTYELRMAALSQQPMPRPDEPARESPIATFDELEGLYAHFDRALTASGFFNPHRRPRQLERLRRLIARGRPEREEVALLRGVLTNLERHVRAAGTEPRIRAAGTEPKSRAAGKVRAEGGATQSD